MSPFVYNLNAARAAHAFTITSAHTPPHAPDLAPQSRSFAHETPIRKTPVKSVMPAPSPSRLALHGYDTNQ